MSDPSYQSNVALLRPFVNGAVSAFIDDVGNSISVYGDVAISTDASVATGHAYQFDGTGDYLRWVGNSSYAFAYGAFTIDLEVKTTQSGCVVSTGVNSTTSWSVSIDTSGHVVFAVNGYAYKTGAIAVNDGNKHHIAIVNYTTPSALMRLWIDGVQDGATFTYGNSFNVAPAYVAVGANVSWDGSVSQLYTGSVGFVRITRDVARWSTSFSVPTVGDIGGLFASSVSSGLSVGEASVGTSSIPVSVAEFFEVGDREAGIWFAILSSSATVGSSYSVSLQAAEHLTAEVHIDNNIGSLAIFGESLKFNASVSDAELVKLIAQSAISEAVKVYTADLNAGNIDEAIQTWVANLATSAHSRYSQYGFNSFAYFEGKHYGCKSDGIYELGGDTDGANPIPWTVTVGETDFGGSNLKRFESVYLGVKASGQLVLKVIKDKDTVYHYNVIPSGNDNRAARAVLGRGLAGRYWNLELASDTERVELDSIDFSFAVMSRRV